MAQPLSGDATDAYVPVRIPSDVDREDTILLSLTARQLMILGATAAFLYGGWVIARTWAPWAVLVVVAVPVVTVAAVLALGKRDGLTLDRLALAALRQRATPRHQVSAPEGVSAPPAWLARRARRVDGNRFSKPPAPLRLPAEDVATTGVVDLGRDGIAVVALCGTVNFGLRTPVEQEALIAAFGRYLHSLNAAVQVLVRVERFDLSIQIAELRDQAAGLPHPALEAAAHEHADFLDQLSRQNELLRRQVLLVLREPLRTIGSRKGRRAALLPGSARTRRTALDRSDHAGYRAAEARLAGRLDEAAHLLRPAGISVTALDAGAATGVLAAACNPESRLPHAPDIAAAGEVITSQAAYGSPLPDADDPVSETDWADSDEADNERWDDDEQRYTS